jgi:hypothetical protein
MNKALIIACCTLMLASTIASAEVYKWKDKSGRIQYSDTPPLSNIPYTTLSGRKPAVKPPIEDAPVEEVADFSETTNGAEQAPKPSPAVPPPPSKEDPNPSQHKVSDDLKEKAAKDEEAKRQQEERLAAESKAKEQACRSARSRLAQFEQGGRIYRVNEQGEREYVGDKEIAVELENAKSDVEENCE